MSETIQLSTLVNLHSPEAVLDEIQKILSLTSNDVDMDAVALSFHNTVNLYKGNFPGYRACTTYYHDLTHAIDTCLTVARLIHGAHLDGRDFADRDIVIALTAALLHDAGFIQEQDDTEGTGAKYTSSHVGRSADFLEQYAHEFGLTAEEATKGRVIILYTDLSIDMRKVNAPNEDIALLGGLLGAADLLAQMADRDYLEKLMFLYHEFEEANVGNYKNQVDMLEKTVEFFDVVDERLAPIHQQVNRFLHLHFAFRWNIDSDLYRDSILNHKSYLKHILSLPDTDPRDHLQRRPGNNYQSMTSTT